MPRALRIFTLTLFVLLGSALLWRAFLHVPTLVSPLQPSPTEQTTAAPLTESDLVLELFNPTEEVIAGQLGESTRKRQIEEAMTISFILRRCNFIDETEYRDTYRAILTYAQRLQPNVPAEQVATEMQRTIASSSASYALIYSRVACDAPALRASAQQLAHWRESLLNPEK